MAPADPDLLLRPQASSDATDAAARLDVVTLGMLERSAQRLRIDIEGSLALWDRSRTRPLTPEERALALDTFLRVLDHQAALGALAETHLDFFSLCEIDDPERCARSFVIGFSAYMAQLAMGLRWVELTRGQLQLEVILDDGSGRHGIVRGAYSRLKQTILDAEHVGRVFAARQYHEHLARPHYDAVCAEHPALAAILDRLDEDLRTVSARLGGLPGASLLARGALDLLRDTTRRAVLPLQAHLCTWLGDTRVRGRAALISPAQTSQAALRCRPGDVVVERRNWYLSNLGLPGFWPHTALWIGTRDELGAVLDDDAEVRRAFDGKFTDHLSRTFPRAFESWMRPDVEGRPPRVLEAVSEGVVFTSAEASLAADYAAAMRPRLPPLELARAVERAFEYFGLPYDFDFDCYSDSSLICSELVYKAYEPRAGVRGLDLELCMLAGRMTLPPNHLVAQVDRDWGGDKHQLDLVWFLDGRERKAAAMWGDESAFRASHRRPKWDLSQE